jgi:hypothetical protein
MILFHDSKWSGDLPNILTYPNFDPLGVSGAQQIKMKNLKKEIFVPKYFNFQNLVQEEMKKDSKLESPQTLLP